MRLFVAIPLPDNVKKELKELRHNLNGFRWKKPNQYHLTLRFIGKTEQSVTEKIDKQLKQIKTGRFHMEIKGFGYFPVRSYPRVLWAGVTQSDALLLLQKKVEEVCRSAGLKPENRPYKPHITVAKVKGASKREVLSFVNQNKRFRIEQIPVSEFILYASTLRSDGAEHKPLSHYPLSGNQ